MNGLGTKLHRVPVTADSGKPYCFACHNKILNQQSSARSGLPNDEEAPYYYNVHVGLDHINHLHSMTEFIGTENATE